MISSLTGVLSRVEESAVELQAGPVGFLVLVPAIDVESLRRQVGTERTFHTLMYLEGDASRGNLEPRVIGFQQTQDRLFFELFTTVKGIGPRTALRALTEPIGTIASWIESRDTRSLTKLAGVGKRTAELVVAQLAGKCARFVDAGVTVKAVVNVPRDAGEEDAIAALVALGERRLDAEALLERAKRSTASRATNDLVREMLRLRGG